MTTIVIVFCVALIVSLSTTPVVRRMGIRYGLIDRPEARKVHKRPVPRIGGLALLFSSLTALVLISLVDTAVADLLHIGKSELLLILGLFIAFGTGFTDDCRRLGYKAKFILQIAAATCAFMAGLRIGNLWLVPLPPLFGFDILSYCVTVFWFLLFINAINLIDGLDGLAAGICFFASTVMILMAMYAGDFYTALFFAALAGSLVGFLPFNFTPASIFMGDGGSYFLGYALAALSIMGSHKTEMGATLMIPLVALGIPIFDVLLSPVRRFLRARSLFSPDSSHIHHHLIAMGLTTKRAVLVCYLITLSLCIFAIVVANFHDEFGGLLLIILGIGTFVFMRFLGYADFLSPHKLLNWFHEINYTLGLQRQRRKLIDYQIKTENARSDRDVWRQVISFLRDIDFDYASFYDSIHTFKGGKSPTRHHSSPKDHTFKIRKAKIDEASVILRKKPPQWTWDNPACAARGHRFSHSLLRMEIPCINGTGVHFGTILIIKDMKRGVFEQHSLRRIDGMRVSVTKAMEHIHND